MNIEYVRGYERVLLGCPDTFDKTCCSVPLSRESISVHLRVSASSDGTMLAPLREPLNCDLGGARVSGTPGTRRTPVYGAIAIIMLTHVYYAIRDKIMIFIFLGGLWECDYRNHPRQSILWTRNGFCMKIEMICHLHNTSSCRSLTSSQQ